MMNIASDREFLAIARQRLRHLFPKLFAQPGHWQRRRGLPDTIEWLIGGLAQDCPGHRDQVVLASNHRGLNHLAREPCGADVQNLTIEARMAHPVIGGSYVIRNLTRSSRTEASVRFCRAGSVPDHEII